MLGTLREFQRQSALAARKLPTCFSRFQGGERSPEPATTPRWEGEGLQGFLSNGGELFTAVQPGRTPLAARLERFHPLQFRLIRLISPLWVTSCQHFKALTFASH